jgi:hypothetical protein
MVSTSRLFETHAGKVLQIGDSFADARASGRALPRAVSANCRGRCVESSAVAVVQLEFPIMNI